MKVYLLISTLLLMIAFHTSAQSDYLITIKGDTLHGEIKLLGVSKPEQVQLILGKKKQNFHPLQAREFSLAGDTYSSVKYYDTYQFMRLIQSGYMSLYAYRIDRQSNFDGRLLVKKDGSIMDVPNLGFKRKLIGFLDDCDDVAEKFEQQEVGRNNIEELINFYNTCIDKKSGSSNTLIANEELRSTIDATKTLLDQVKSSKEFSGKADAIAIIEDVRAKLLRNENIPGYLQEALKSSLSNLPEINNQLQELLNALKN